MTYILIGFAAFVVLYLAGHIPHVGDLYVFTFGIIGLPLKLLEQALARVSHSQKSESKYPGLRTVMLIVALVLALLALVAETLNSLQALTALWGGIDTNISLPSFVNLAMGALFLAVPALFGAIWIEPKVVPEESRIFNVPADHAKKFEGFIFRSFLLSCITCMAFYALRPYFLANPDSNITHLLQIGVFVLMGLLVPLVGVIALYILAVGLHAVIVLALTPVWFVVSVLSGLCEHIVSHFKEIEKKRQEKNKPPPIPPYAWVQRDTPIPSTPAQTLLPEPGIADKDTGPLPAEDESKKVEDESKKKAQE